MKAFLIFLISGLLLADEFYPERVGSLNVQPLDHSEEGFTLAVVPDTQHYTNAGGVRRSRDIGYLRDQLQWIERQYTSELVRIQRNESITWNIKFFLNLGDITQDNDPDEWQLAAPLFTDLLRVVPGALTTGNHDMGPGGQALNRDSLFNQYLGHAEIFSNLVSVYEDGHFENSLHRFQFKNQTYMVLMLEFGPRDEVLRWARNLLRRYSRAKVIVATHSYVHEQNRREHRGDNHNPHGYGLATVAGNTVNDGEEIWRKLIYPSSNIFMVLNGHHLGRGAGRVVSFNRARRPVYQIFSNYQMRPHGGEGFFRLMRFLPSRNRIEVYSYSPSLNRFMIEPEQNFWIDLSSNEFRAD